MYGKLFFELLQYISIYSIQNDVDEFHRNHAHVRFAPCSFTLLNNIRGQLIFFWRRTTAADLIMRFMISKKPSTAQDGMGSAVCNASSNKPDIGNYQNPHRKDF